MTGAVVWSTSIDMTLTMLTSGSSTPTVVTVPSGLLAGYAAGMLIVNFAVADSADPAAQMVGPSSGGILKFRDASAVDHPDLLVLSNVWIGQDALRNPAIAGAADALAMFDTELSGLGFDTLNNGGSVICALAGSSAPGNIAMTGSLSAVMYGYSPTSDPTGLHNRVFFNTSPAPTQPSSDPGSATNTLSLSPIFAGNVTEFGFIVGAGIRGHDDASSPAKSIFTSAVTPSVTDAGGVWTQIEAHAHDAGWTCIAIAGSPVVASEDATWFSSLPYLDSHAWQEGVFARKIALQRVRPYAAIIG